MGKQLLNRIIAYRFCEDSQESFLLYKFRDDKTTFVKVVDNCSEGGTNDDNITEVNKLPFIFFKESTKFVDGIGGYAWNGSLLMSYYLEQLDLTHTKKRIHLHELGCGAGVPTIVSSILSNSRCDISITLSDREIDLADLNIMLAKKQLSDAIASSSFTHKRIKAFPLSWGGSGDSGINNEAEAEQAILDHGQGPCHILVGCEVACLRQQQSKLVTTIQRLVDAKALILISFDDQPPYYQLDKTSAAATLSTTAVDKQSEPLQQHQRLLKWSSLGEEDLDHKLVVERGYERAVLFTGRIVWEQLASNMTRLLSASTNSASSSSMSETASVEVNKEGEKVIHQHRPHEKEQQQQDIQVVNEEKLLFQQYLNIRSVFYSDNDFKDSVYKIISETTDYAVTASNSSQSSSIKISRAVLEDLTQEYPNQCDDFSVMALLPMMLSTAAAASSSTTAAVTSSSDFHNNRHCHYDNSCSICKNCLRVLIKSEQQLQHFHPPHSTTTATGQPQNVSADSGILPSALPSQLVPTTSSVSNNTNNTPDNDLQHITAYYLPDAVSTCAVCHKKYFISLQ